MEPTGQKEDSQLLRLQGEAQIERDARARYGSDFATFIKNVDPDYPLEYWHLQKTVSALDKVADGRIKRLMIFMPPGYFKSVSVSKLFPPHYLYKFPKRRFILASYSADLSNTMSRKARENYEKTGRLLSTESYATHAWDTVEGGGFYSLGIGGTVAGKRGRILLLDDFMKSKEEAYSQSYRDGQWEWWKWVWSQRKEPNSAFIIMTTRWHLDDVVGRLFEQEMISPEHWHIINFQGIKGKQQEFPETCTVEEDPRQTGEPLCVEIHTKEQLLHEKALDDVMFEALFQQNPVKETGEIWKREWFKTIPDYQFDNLLSTLKDYGTDWDTAYTTDESNSASAMVQAGVGADGNIYVNDIDSQYLEFPELVDWMLRTPTTHFIEAKASGKSAVQSLMKVGVYAAEIQVKGGQDKIARARLASPIVKQGRVFIRQSLITKLLDDPKQGLVKFPSAAGTEYSDIFSQMLNRLWPYTVKEQKKQTAQEIWDSQVAAAQRGENQYVPVHKRNQETNGLADLL